MNSLFEDDLPGHHSMRDLLMTVLSDADLAYKLPGHNPTLGELLMEMGNIEAVYAQSVRTFTLDWAYRPAQPATPLTVDSLTTWFKTLDAELNNALSRFTEEEVRIARIDRGSGFIASPYVQYEIYREAVFIFYGKLSVYLKALEIHVGEQWDSWVG